MELKNSQKLSKKIDNLIACELCDYTTSRMSDYKKHLTTLKHCRQQMELSNSQKVSGKHVDNFECKCGKTYVNRSSMWKHRQKCEFIEIPDVTNNNLINNNETMNNAIIINSNSETNLLTNAIVNLINQNNELKNIVLEQSKQSQEQKKHTLELTTQTLSDVSKHITTELVNAIKSGQICTINNYTNTMNNNNTFNLQVFLNETCKDALNMDEFINNITITNADLEETARLGYTGGISRIFINELNSMDVTKKPIHCSDAKREIIYIKENNVWEKDDDQKSNLIKAIKKAARKNYLHIFKWEQDYPQCKKDPDSKLGKLYNKIVINSMSGSSDAEQIDNINRIVKIVIKNSIIDKQLSL